jgi:hypothetical protein
MKKILRIIAITVLLGACLWVSFNYLIWSLPAQPRTHDIALADLDGDGDLDAFLANGRNEVLEPNTVLLNDGQGNFLDSGQSLGKFESWGVALADFDVDGDIDALVSNISWGEYFWNKGDGTFQRKQSVNFPDTDGYHIGIWRFQVADLNGDGRVDLFLNGCCGGGLSNGPEDWQTINAFNTIWLSNGEGLPKYTGQKMSLGSSQAVGLGDLDGDGDLDAFVANSAHLDEAGDAKGYDPNEIWLNDGNGIFTDSGQRLGEQRSYSVALGDLDADGDLDVFVGNMGADEIWFNNGDGTFSDSGQRLGDSLTRYLYLNDLDGDGDLDAFIGSDKNGRLWLNDGQGNFKVTSQRIDYAWGYAITLGDVDGNGTIDILAGKVDTAKVWLNDGTGQMRIVY